jgi:hypothetical protein
VGRRDHPHRIRRDEDRKEQERDVGLEHRPREKIH